MITLKILFVPADNELPSVRAYKSMVLLMVDESFIYGLQIYFKSVAQGYKR